MKAKAGLYSDLIYSLFSYYTGVLGFQVCFVWDLGEEGEKYYKWQQDIIFWLVEKFYVLIGQ